MDPVRSKNLINSADSQANRTSNGMDQLINLLKKDYPDLKFVAGEDFFWSPETSSITYNPQAVEAELTDVWTLLHEVGHALLDHKKYFSDVELLLLEAAAWQKANELAKDYQIAIDQDHVQDYLDTYRDWLYKRSSCPICGMQSLQSSPKIYSCFNCRANWQVSEERFCRPYRLLKTN